MGFILFPSPKTISTFHHLKWLWFNLLESNYDIYRFYVALFFLKSLFLFFCKSMKSLYTSRVIWISLFFPLQKYDISIPLFVISISLFFPLQKYDISIALFCYLDLSFFPFAKVWYLYTALMLFETLFFPFAKLWYLSNSCFLILSKKILQ